MTGADEVTDPPLPVVGSWVGVVGSVVGADPVGVGVGVGSPLGEPLGVGSVEGVVVPPSPVSPPPWVGVAPVGVLPASPSGRPLSADPDGVVPGRSSG